MASRSLILLLLRLRCDNMGQSWRAPRPLLILLSLSSNRLSFGNLGNPLSVVRPTLIKLSDSKLTYSSLRPSICVARALSRFNSSICKEKCNLSSFHLQSNNAALYTHTPDCYLQVWRLTLTHLTEPVQKPTRRHIATRQATSNLHFPTLFHTQFHSHQSYKAKLRIFQKAQIWQILPTLANFAKKSCPIECVSLLTTQCCALYLSLPFSAQCLTAALKFYRSVPCVCMCLLSSY